MSDCGTPAGDTFYGPGGHYDVRGRKAVRKAIEEEEKDRRAREMSAGKSRLELAEEAAKRRHGMRQILPNQCVQHLRLTSSFNSWACVMVVCTFLLRHYSIFVHIYQQCVFTL